MEAPQTAGKAQRSSAGFVGALFGPLHRYLQGPPTQTKFESFLWAICRIVIYWMLMPVMALAFISIAGAALGFWKVERVAVERTADACVNQLTGSVWRMESAVKATLRDPGSFQHVESAGTKPDANGDISVRMTYRARNGFGGMNVETAHAVVHKDCSVTLTN